MAGQKQPVATEKFREMDKKRWLVRYLVNAIALPLSSE